jgi:LmbE family N-acetylglucosaminyl deacetylase
MKNWRRALVCGLTYALACSFTFATPSLYSPVYGAEMKRDSPPAILHELKKFRQMGSALYIAAHPDDENTELLAYLARGRDYRTAYLSLTRGDGGQNVLGSDLGAKLGMARTQELLAARQIDGAQQFFSRAVDFGFSKNYVETLKVWNKQEILSDMVRVIRQFRPDVLITRFAPTPGGTHGHHTASTVLALEAFKLAGDATAFPDQIKQGLKPWQPKRIMWNVSTWQKDKIAAGNLLKIDAGGFDPVSGESFTDIASYSRAMHKTQGFDSFKITGVNGAPRIESFQHLDGEPAHGDIMDGVDTSWKRVKGGAEIGSEIDAIISKFDQHNVVASVPELLKLRKKLAALPPSDNLQGVIDEKRAQLDRILQLCLGLEVETTIDRADYVPGEPVTLKHSAVVHAKLPPGVTVRFTGVRYPEINKEVSKSIDLHSNEIASFEAVEPLPGTALLAHPWWLRVEGSAGMFEVGDPKLIGTAQNAPSFPVESIFQIGNQTLVVQDQPVQVENGAEGLRVSKPLSIIAPISLHCDIETLVLTPGATKTVTVEVAASRADITGTVALEAPEGWAVAPANRSFSLAKVGETAQFQFTVTAPAKPSSARIAASARVKDVDYRSRREVITYAHIPPQILHAPAVVKAVSVDLNIAGKSVGFIPGAGETLPESLRQMGYTVKTLDDGDLTAEKLHEFDAVIFGLRAFNVRKKIDEYMPAIFEYVKNGGTVITQYNRPDKMTTTKIAPYQLQISSDRVTDENAVITFLDPANKVLNSPNKLTSADFDNWVQERGLYFAGKWSKEFTPIIACSDEGEAPLKGGLLIAQYGKGHYIYTGLSLFRQLPAGVPGAYRLLANMIAVGK